MNDEGQEERRGLELARRMSGKSDPSVCAAVWLGDAAALKRMLWPKSAGKPTKEGRDNAFILANSRGKDGESPLHVAG